jgi:hypothetical protein
MNQETALEKLQKEKKQLLKEMSDPEDVRQGSLTSLP